MLRKILTALILLPLAAVIVAFAVANRQAVTLSLDPFDAAHPAYAATLPLFVVIFIVLIVGVIIGGVAAWLRQSYWRRATRRLDNEVRTLHGEIDAMRTRFAASEPAPARREEPQPAPPPLILPPTVP